MPVLIEVQQLDHRSITPTILRKWPTDLARLFPSLCTRCVASSKFRADDSDRYCVRMCVGFGPSSFRSGRSVSVNYVVIMVERKIILIF